LKGMYDWLEILVWKILRVALAYAAACLLMLVFLLSPLRHNAESLRAH
jgi:hypothetical protein